MLRMIWKWSRSWLDNGSICCSRPLYAYVCRSVCCFLWSFSANHRITRHSLLVVMQMTAITLWSVRCYIQAAHKILLKTIQLKLTKRIKFAYFLLDIWILTCILPYVNLWVNWVEATILSKGINIFCLLNLPKSLLFITTLPLQGKNYLLFVLFCTNRNYPNKYF